MIGDLSLSPRGSFAGNHVRKRFSIPQPPDAPGLKRFQAITHFHLRQERLAKDAPRLITTTRQGRHIGKRLLSVLWTVSSTKGANQPHQLSPKFQSAINQRCIEKLSD